MAISDVGDEIAQGKIRTFAKIVIPRGVKPLPFVAFGHTLS
jgi:hypothetical protein